MDSFSEPSVPATPALQLLPQGPRYRALLAQDFIGIAELSLAGRIQIANRRFSEIVGLPNDGLLGKTLGEIVIAEDVALIVRKIETIVRDGAPCSIEIRAPRADARVVWINLNITRISVDAPFASSLLVVASDASALHRLEEAERASSERYRTLFNSIDAGFCVIKMLFDAHRRPIDYVFLETNAAFERATGLTRVRGVRMRQLSPAHEQHWFDIYGHVAVSGEATRFEQEARMLNRWFSVYAFRIDHPGEHHVAVLFEDISARKRAEHRRMFLSELSDRISHATDEAEVMQSAVETLGRFIEADRCFLARWIEDTGQIVVVADYTRGDNQSLAGAWELTRLGGSAAWRALAAGKVSIHDIRDHKDLGEHAAVFQKLGIVSLIASPIRKESRLDHVFVVSDAKPRHWSADEGKLIEDVIARAWPVVERARSNLALRMAHKELERRVVERTARLQETVSELETYSYSISHDLRAPLRAMQTYASILLEECGSRIDADGHVYLGRIINAANRMDQLIHDVLLFSRTARAEAPLEAIELHGFIAGVIDTYPGLGAGRAQIDLASDLATVRANPAALTQCVSNLLGNAIKFVPAGTKPHIRIWTEIEGARARLFIRDNGPGIPRELHEKIFGIFYQGNSSQEGTGIGLAVVRKAVERMGGKVGVESTSGEGSTFWIELETVAPAKP